MTTGSGAEINARNQSQTRRRKAQACEKGCKGQGKANRANDAVAEKEAGGRTYEAQACREVGKQRAALSAEVVSSKSIVLLSRLTSWRLPSSPVD